MDGWLAGRHKVPMEANGFVGDRCTYADLSFIRWQRITQLVLSKETFYMDDNSHAKAWLEKMMERPALKKGLARME
jgi:glutathione S-transferase